LISNLNFYSVGSAIATLTYSLFIKNNWPENLTDDDKVEDSNNKDIQFSQIATTSF
jgi:hypothetical protein